MLKVKSLFALLFLSLFLLPQTNNAQVATSAYLNFETSQTNPVRLSPDGTRLFAVNTPDARLSVFDLASPSSPRLIAEIPVGIEPVSVNPLSNDEVWVVNQESDSISIVSISRKIVTDTIYVKDEPSDVVFAGAQLAFVSVARNNEVRVFNTTTHAQVASIPLSGMTPRALAVSPDGSKIYAAFQLAGNRTTIIPAQNAPPPPPPINSRLPGAPAQGIIVDATDPLWAPSHVKFTMPDNDVVEIDAATLTATRYFSRVGTINLGLAVQPITGDLYVANTEARNLVRFEPNLRGHVVDNRISRVSVNNGGAVTPFDLNAAINYNAALPNAAAKTIALAQPTAVVFDPTGSFMYVAAFGTDRVARVNPDGTIASRIEVGTATGANADPKTKRGPRGLALNSITNRLYVLNRISNTISVIDTSLDKVAREIAVGSFDPTPTVIRNGRGFLYDARLSGNGTAACAACHIDSDMDLLAWDLGDPNGAMKAVTNSGSTFQMHPMKGPMTTQTLRGITGTEPLHWRGDQTDLLAFNPAFDTLLGGGQLSTADMTAFRDFVNTIRYQPNPNQNLDRTFPTSFAGGDAVAGRNTFLNEPFTSTVTCNTCHTANPGTGTNKAIFAASLLGEPQDMKVPQLRNMYQKVGYNKTAGAPSLLGFGFEHDGNTATLFEFLSQAAFQSFATDTVRKNNLSAFMLCFDTGIAPAVGYTRTVTALNLNIAAVNNDWTLLQNQAVAKNIDLIIKGTIDGQVTGLLYRPATNDYTTDRTGSGPFTQAQLKTKIQAGDTLSVMGVPVGTGTRMGIDRDLNGLLDGDPPPVLHVSDIVPTDVNGVVKTSFTKGQTVYWRVVIVDQNNRVVNGASAKTDVFNPNATLLTSLTATSGTDGRAKFSRAMTTSNATGNYNVRVNTVTKSGATYAANTNVKTSTTFNLQ